LFLTPILKTEININDLVAFCKETITSALHSKTIRHNDNFKNGDKK